MLLNVGCASGPSTTPASAPAVSQAAPGEWLFAYFRQRYDSRVEVDAAGHIHNIPLSNPMRVEQLHFALSTDGRHWTPLNDDQPVWSHRLRDPYVQRGADGWWHLVATGGQRSHEAGTNAGPVCLYARSQDLVHWEEVRSLALMSGVRDATGRPARNIWAPEWFYDRKTGDTVVLWSSSFEEAGWQHSRLWYARTRDWKTFTPAQVLFAPPYSVIDGTLQEHDGTYFLFHKEEEFGAATGERRGIRLATAQKLEGPYQIFNGPLNGGQIAPTITEGPEVMPDPTQPGWLLVYDFCMADGFGISTSPDLYHWTVDPAVSFPPDARHGCVTHLTAAEAARLRRLFAGKD